MKKIVTLIVLSLSLVACTSDQITLTLAAVVDAAISAATIAAPQDVGILNEVSGCVDASTGILDSTTTGVNKAGQIASACASAVAATQNAPPILQAVAAALKTFMTAVSAISNTADVPQYTIAVNSFLGADASGKPEKMSHKKLMDIRKKNEKLKKVLEKKK